MKTLLLAVVIVALIAFAAGAQNQPSPDQRIRQLEVKLAAVQDRVQKLETPSAAIGDPLLNLRAFQNSIDVLRLQKADLLRLYSPEYPKVRAIDKQIDFLRSEWAMVGQQIDDPK
jgi:hypothetical protein